MKNTNWLGEQVPLTNVNLYYEKHGSGQPLICLHNFSANGRSRFTPMLPILTKRFTCYLVDLRAHGRSDNPTGIWTHEESAKDIIELCEKLHIENAYFLGTSSGGMTLLKVVRMKPELVQAMVIDSATIRVPETSRKFYRRPDLLKPSIVKLYEEANEIYGKEYWRYLAQTFYDFRLPECDVNIKAELLQDILAPTLIIYGDRDAFFPVDIAIDMKRNIPNSSLSIFPNTGHIVAEFYPERVAEMAVDFLTKQKRA
ncbi:MAG TPA: alpha/beta hydrolase [Candidatus Kapabacteria bacterium]